MQLAARSSRRRQGQGFCLTHAPVESEKMLRAKEHENVKVQMLCMFLYYMFLYRQSETYSHKNASKTYHYSLFHPRGIFRW